MVRELFAGRGLSPSGVREVVIGSVVPPLTASMRGMASDLLRTEALVVDHRLRLSLKLEVSQPSQLGADRIANATAALRLRGAPVVVVDLGTAITFDVVSAEGSYLGGLIAPGLQTGLEELVRRASRLPRVDLDTPPSKVIGRTTEEAMRSGLLWGAAMQVDGLVRLIWKELGTRCPVIATGGQTSVIAPLMVTVNEVEPNLTLRGLRMIYETNRREED